MLKKNLKYLLLGVITESVKGLILAMCNGDRYEFIFLKFIFNIIAFTLFYSELPSMINTIKLWQKKSRPEKTCTICELLSVCMIIGIIISNELNLILICEIGLSVICAVMTGLTAISLIMKKNKRIVVSSVKWIAMLLIAEYTMSGTGVVTYALV